MITIGKMNTLRVTEAVIEGLYLDGEEHGEIFLQSQAAAKRFVEGDSTEAFVYRDVDGQVAATSLKPLVEVDQFALLRVTGLHPDIGAFLDWGLPKDLLMPSKEIDVPVQKGDLVVVFVFIDPATGKIFATSRLSDRVSPAPPDYEVGEPVDLIIVRPTPLGYIALINRSHLGLLYHSALHEEMEVGQEVQGYIGAIRPDGKIDLTLDSSGAHRVNSLTEQILAALRRNDRRIAFDDSSSPDEIRVAFGASKKAFKQALGSLFKQRLIRFTHPGVELIQDPARAPKRGERIF